MPTYDFKCNSCDHAWEEFLLMKDHDKPTKEPCPKCKEKTVVKTFGSAPAICDPVTIGRRKPDNGFGEVLSKIKEKTGQRNFSRFE